ncbi:unnamed protein product, partial [Rotaria sp. Silwood2]
MTENIDKICLDSELRCRFEYLSKFFDFTNDDIKILNDLSIYIQPIIPVIVDKVYRKLFSFDITKHFFFHNYSCFGTLFSSENNSNVSFHS